MFRVTLRADESYRIGELVECLHQKSVWTRGRVVNIRTNNTFDIKYDAGDEVRFVYPNKVRLLAEKKPFAYHVEIAMVALVVSFPLCLLLCVTVSPGLLGLSLLLVSVALLTRHVTLVVQYAINYSKAGLCPQLLLSLPISLPLLLLLVAAASTVSAGAAVPWTSVAALFAVAKFLSLPALAMMRKTYAVMGLGLFVLSSLAVIMAALLASGALTWPYSGAIAVAPSIILTCVLKYLRVHLHLIWDVCLVSQSSQSYFPSNALYMPLSLSLSLPGHSAGARRVLHQRLPLGADPQLRQERRLVRTAVRICPHCTCCSCLEQYPFIVHPHPHPPPSSFFARVKYTITGCTFIQAESNRAQGSLALLSLPLLVCTCTHIAVEVICSTSPRHPRPASRPRDRILAPPTSPCAPECTGCPLLAETCIR